MKDEHAQALYAQFVQLQEQAQALEEHMQSMHEQLHNIEKTKETLDELQQLSTPQQSWVPIAPGAYAKAQLQPADTILINVGANVAVEKKPDEVLATLEEHKRVLEELSDAAMQELKQIYADVDKIRKQVEKEEQ